MELANQIFWGIVAVGCFILMGFMYWIDYKKSLHTKQQTDPIQKAILLSLLLWGFLAFAEAVGYFEKGWNQKNLWIHIAILVVLLTLFWIIASRKKPLSYEKQKEIVKKYVYSEYYADKYVGDANIHWLNVYKITVEGNSNDTRGEVGNFLVNVMAEDSLQIWVQLNVYTGQLLHIQMNPPIELLFKLTGKDSPKGDKFADQFEDNAKTNNPEPSRD